VNATQLARPGWARDFDRRVTPSSRPFSPAFAAASGGSRGERRRPPLHPLETALVGVTAVHLCFLPWALGTMHAWSQLTSLGFAIVEFVLVALPRTGTGDFVGAPGAIQWPAARLLRFPVFWAGLILLGYIAVQGFNPAWRFIGVAHSWWIEPISHVSWLPSGVDAPFVRSNPWRALTVDGSLWLLVCAVWAGFLRRKSYRALFFMLVCNAFSLALLGVLQKLSGTDRIYWSYLPSNSAFIASFIYPNHAGAYFNLMVALAAGLAWWHRQRARRHLENPGQSFFFMFLAVFTGLAVISTYSRMSVVLLLVLMVLAGGVFVLGLFRRAGRIRDRMGFLLLTVALAGVIGTGLVVLRTAKVWERLADQVAHPVAFDRDRTLARQASRDMLCDRWLLGWGAGCFRYNFEDYAAKYPEIYYAGNRRMYWEHAHDDLLEFPVELGAAGMLPLAGILGYGGWQLGRRRFWRNAVSFCIVLGCALVLLHAWVDFVFQNPAVLLTWGVLLVGAVRWAELDQSGGRRSAEPLRR
jgi:O-Antigen ligase